MKLRGAPSAIVVVLVLLGSAACTSAHHLHAAEPAHAPVTSVPAAGTVHTTGDAPEGIVYDPVTKTLVVAMRNPDRLALLDPQSLNVRRLIPLPGSVRHLQLAAPGGPVLVPVETANELFDVPLPDGPATVTTVGRQPHDATGLSDGQVVVGNEFGRSLSVIRGGQVARTVAGVQQPGGVIADGLDVVVVDVAEFTLDTFDVETGTRTGRVAAGSGPTHGALLAANRVLVVDTRGNAVLIFDTDPLRLVTTFPLAGTPYGLALDTQSQTAWITLTARNELVGLDLSGPQPQVIARYPTVRQPNTVAVSSDSHDLWVTGTRDGELEHITR